MVDALPEDLARQLDELRRERERLGELVAAYRVVRASRFARARELVLALKRVFVRLDEAPPLAILEIPAFEA